MKVQKTNTVTEDRYMCNYYIGSTLDNINYFILSVLETVL